MTIDNWSELYYLAAQFCPMAIADFSSLPSADAYGLLLFLRRKAAEARP